MTIDLFGATQDDALRAVSETHIASRYELHPLAHFLLVRDGRVGLLMPCERCVSLEVSMQDAARIGPQHWADMLVGLRRVGVQNRTWAKNRELRVRLQHGFELTDCKRATTTLPSSSHKPIFQLLEVDAVS